MHVTVIGTGYVGLVAGACFADLGHTVTCLDKDKRKIDLLRQGGIPIYEPGLETLVQRNVREERLSFGTEVNGSVSQADAVFIAVGTPQSANTGHADLSYVYAVAEEIAPALRGFTVVVNKSTVPVGTGDEVEAIIRKKAPGADFAVVSNPEFLREGAAIADFMKPDRVVIGADEARGREVMAELYRPLTLNESPVIFTGRRTAELIKYAANAFLAMKITFINEIADLCEAIGGDVEQISKGIGLDERIGAKFLQPGPGYGGFCFPKDTKALASTAFDAGRPLELVEATVRVNEKRKTAMAHKIAQAMGGDIAGKTIAVLGLTFKANTDDMREAPSLVIVPALQAMGAKIRATDPEAHGAETLLSDVDYVTDAYAAAEGADCVVLLTEWAQFRVMDFAKIKASMKSPVLVDLRNIYEPGIMRELGFSYHSVGRP